MRSLMYGVALIAATTTMVFADDMPAAPPPPDASTTTSTTTTTTTTTTTGADPMAVLYGNTLIVKGSGPESHTRYKADHTFEGIAPAFNYPYQGTWEITAEGKLCRTFNPEVPTVSNPDCDGMPPGAHVLGDTWTDDKGNTLSIAAGVQ